MSEREPEVVEALTCMDSGQDFIMTGGAGSGKTYSMMQLLKALYERCPSASIACVTYTNIAVNEIKSRFPSRNLQVSTIHEFLWSLIHRFQKNVRESLASLVNDGSIKTDLELPVSPTFWKGPIKYKEWASIADGEISHSELLRIAQDLFDKHPDLAKILSDKFDYLLVDEYQDTPVEMLTVLLESLPQPSERQLRIGFFGDGEQAIHEGNSGNSLIDKVKNTDRLHSIVKTQNRRNPSAIIDVINHLRSDGLVQIQSDDESAPNYRKRGTARFVYTLKTELNSDKLRRFNLSKDWDFSSSETKLLYLSKSMIARECNFPSLMEIYDKDRVIEYAKRLEKALTEKNIPVAENASLGEVIEKYGAYKSPTPAQQTAFNSDPSAIDFASSFSFHEIAATSTNSDKLLGTKKVSDLDLRDRGEKRDALINHLIAIEELRTLFTMGKFNAIIRLMDTTITSIKDRERIASDLKTLDSMTDSPIGDVIMFAESTGIMKQKDAMLQFKTRHPYRYARVASVSFRELSNLYRYVEDFSPYSTQHGVKGSEWSNIFVALDNGGWNQYNFERIITDPQGETPVHVRSRMMLYVACSRAKENLLVYVHQPDGATLSRAKDWFGEDSVILAD